MKYAVTVGIVAIGLVASLGARQTERAARDRAVAVIQRHIDAGQAMQLSADSIVLTGDELSLKGHALLQFEDSFVTAEGATVNRATKRVELLGNVRVSDGRSLAPAGPRIEPR